MKRSSWCICLTAALITGFTWGQSRYNEPTRQEIEQAYRSKSGESDILFPRVRWEHWRIKEIRGWSLHFKHVSESRSLGILTRRYQVMAKKNGSCAEYHITDTVPFPPNNAPLKPILVVEPTGVNPCR